MPFVRGPDELKDIPGYFGGAAKASDMTKEVMPIRPPTSANSFVSFLSRLRYCATGREGAIRFIPREPPHGGDRNLLV